MKHDMFQNSGRTNRSCREVFSAHDAKVYVGQSHNKYLGELGLSRN